LGRKGAEDVAVIGGGLAGMKAALDLARLGRKVTLIESSASLGGKASRDVKDYKFPKRDASLDYIDTIMMDVEWNKNIKTMPLTTVKGAARDEKTKTFKLKLLTKARHVFDVCTACQLCVDPCPVTTVNEYSDGVGTRKAVFIPNFYASPRLYVIDEGTCLWYKDKSCRKCEEVCPVDAIRFEADQKDAETDLAVDAVILAADARPMALDAFPLFGAGKHPNVITVEQANRFLDPGGPTGGELRLPESGFVKDTPQLLVGNYHGAGAHAHATEKVGKRPKSVAFVQTREKGGAWADNGRVTLRGALDVLKAAALDSPGIKILLIYDKDAAATMKGQIIGAAKQFGVQVVEGVPVGIESKDGTVKLTWQASDGQQTANVDLAVVITPLAIPDEARTLVGLLGMKLDEAGFAAPEGRLQSAGMARSPMTLEEAFEDASNAVGRLMLTLARA